MKRMLINATHSEEVRVALADGQKLYNLDIDVPGQDRKKGNIYLGKITRVEPSLEAAFVEYGGNRHGFLPYKEISRNYYTEKANKAKERPPINVAIKEGTQVVIQVNKEERGNKGAAITTYVSLAGRYLVYMPENPKAGGISRRIEGKARQELKTTLKQVSIPKNSGVIVRTAGIGRSVDEIEWDLNYLDQVWTSIKTASINLKAPAFLYQESAIEIRALRDYLRPDVGEILIDDKKIYEKTKAFMQQVMPHNLKKLSYYNDTIPLFSRYQIESQIQSAFSREVHLPSGGSLVIDHTEAMISIDINSARATKGSDIEETALNTNLEAADEIARQMRIRDLGGLLVIDFIDMRNHKNQRAVEQQLNEAVSNDRARIQTSKISKFGLLEMSRQRLKSSINESSQFACPRCSGHGFIRNIESLSVSIIRIMEEEALKPETGKVIAQVPTKVANFIINDKRDELMSLETRHSVPMYVIANEHYQTPQFDVVRLKKSEIKNFDISEIKLNKPENEEEAENKSSQARHQQRQVAVVDSLVPDSKVPDRIETQSSVGIFGWLSSLFLSNSSGKTEKPTPKQKQYSNKKKPQGKKPQNNRKPNHNKPVAKQKQDHQNKNYNDQQSNKAKKPVQQNKQTNKKKPQHKNQQVRKQPVHQQKNINKDNSTENVPNNDQLIQRPLGSVASYAANKAKKAQVETTTKDSKAVDTTSKGNLVKDKVSTSNTKKLEDNVQKNKDTVVEAKTPDKNIKLEKTSKPQEAKQQPVQKVEVKEVQTKKVEIKVDQPKVVETKALDKKPVPKKETATTKAEQKPKDEPKSSQKETVTKKIESKSKEGPKPSQKETVTKKIESKSKDESKPSQKEIKAEPKPKPATKVKTSDKNSVKSKPQAPVKKPLNSKDVDTVKKLASKTKVEKPIKKTPLKPKKKMPDPTEDINFDI